MLPKLNDPRLRLFGVHHVAVAWMTTEKEWTTEKGQGSNNLASNTVPLLDRASAPAAEAGGAAGGAGAMMMGGGPGPSGGGMAGMMNQMKGMGAGRNNMEGMMGGRMGGMGAMGGMAAMYGQAGGAQADLKKQLKTLTRTDFLIQFVWQPLKEEEKPKTDEDAPRS